MGDVLLFLKFGNVEFHAHSVVIVELLLTEVMPHCIQLILFPYGKAAEETHWWAHQSGLRWAENFFQHKGPPVSVQ